MEKRRLRNIEVSPIGIGCMGFSHGYGEIPTEEYSIEAIRKAYEFGCTFFDTAEAYGPNMLPENKDHNEKIVGVMEKFIDAGLIRGWGLSQVDVDVIDRANKETPLSAIQNIYLFIKFCSSKLGIRPRCSYGRCGFKLDINI